MSRAQLCILNWIFDEYLKYDVKKRRTKISRTTHHSLLVQYRGSEHNLEHLWSDVRDSRQQRSRGWWQFLYRYAPLPSHAQNLPCVTAEYRLSYTDWDALRALKTLLLLEVKGWHQLSPPQCLRERVWGCEANICGVNTRRGDGCHHGGGGGLPVTGRTHWYLFV